MESPHSFQIEISHLISLELISKIHANRYQGMLHEANNCHLPWSRVARAFHNLHLNKSTNLIWQLLTEKWPLKCQLTHFQENLEIHLKDKIKNSVKIYFEIYVKTTIYQTGLKDQEE